MSDHFNEAKRLIAMCVDSEGNPPATPAPELESYMRLAQIHAALAIAELLGAKRGAIEARAASGSNAPEPGTPLGQAVFARRDYLRMTQDEVAERGGLSTASLRIIENGRQKSFRPRTLSALDVALGWPRGTARSLPTT